MKTKFLLAGLLFAGFAAHAQTGRVETPNETGLGTENGASRYSEETPGSTFLGYRAGYTTDGKQYNGPDNTFVGNQAGYSNTLGSQNAYFGGFAGYNGNNILTINNTFIGFKAGYTNASGANNTFTGWQSGYLNTASNNSFYGYQSGHNTTTGAQNTFVGSSAGYTNSTGYNNVYIGNNAGYSSQTSPYNVFVGYNSGYFQNSTYGGNVFLGYAAGNNNTSGYGNVFIGFTTGSNNITGINNIFIGNSAGQNETGSEKLYIDNSSTSTPLIKGDFNTNQLTFNGKVSITNSADQAALFPSTSGSVSVSNYYLFVKGGILTEEVRVHLKASGGWADYVFADDYKLKPLSEVEKYIAEKGHLPNIPSAQEVKENGLELGQMSNLQQEKIEELTLYAIQQDKQIIAQEKQLAEQKSQLEQQQKEIEELKAAVKALATK